MKSQEHKKGGEKMNRNFRGKIFVCALVLSALGFVSVAGAGPGRERPAQPEGKKYGGQTLTLLMWGSGWDDSMQAAAAEFEKQFGVTVRSVSQESSSDGLIKLQAQKGKPTVDV